MSKILVFENEITEVNTAFDAVNYLNFQGNLHFDYFTSSQDFKPFSDIVNYDLILIDIVLAQKSEKDGFGIIHEIISKYPDLIKKSIILTGDSKINEKLIERQLPILDIIEKPIGIEQVKKIFLKYILKTN